MSFKVNSTETFVEKARSIWGDRYDYTDSKFISMRSPITIYCPKHDYPFLLQMAQNHLLKGHAVGCPICKYETQYGMEFGKDDWQKLLRRSTKNSRMGLISRTLSEEEKEQRAAERKAKAEEQRRIRQEQKRIEKEKRKAEYDERIRLQKIETQRRKEEKKKERAALAAERAVEREKQRIKALQEMIRREAPKAQGKGYHYRGINKLTRKDGTVLVHCPNPEHEWHPMRIDLILQGCKCRECAGRHTPLEKRCQTFIEKALKKHGPNHYDYSKVPAAYVNNDTPVPIRCLIHDKWFETAPDNNLRKANGSCPICAIEMTDSDGEREIRVWLEAHHIRNERGVNMPNENKDCKRSFLVPDFWLPDHNTFIEYNGKQHYEDVKHFNNKGWTLEDQQIRDQTMRDYCQRHGHRLIEIPYWDFDSIGEILQKSLLDKQ